MHTPSTLAIQGLHLDKGVAYSIGDLVFMGCVLWVVLASAQNNKTFFSAVAGYWSLVSPVLILSIGLCQATRKIRLQRPRKTPVSRVYYRAKQGFVLRAKRFIHAADLRFWSLKKSRYVYYQGLLDGSCSLPMCQNLWREHCSCALNSGSSGHGRLFPFWSALSKLSRECRVLSITYPWTLAVLLHVWTHVCEWFFIWKGCHLALRVTCSAAHG